MTWNRSRKLIRTQIELSSSNLINTRRHTYYSVFLSESEETFVVKSDIRTQKKVKCHSIQSLCEILWITWREEAWLHPDPEITANKEKREWILFDEQQGKIGGTDHIVELAWGLSMMYRDLPKCNPQVAWLALCAQRRVRQPRNRLTEYLCKWQGYKDG